MAKFPYTPYLPTVRLWKFLFKFVGRKAMEIIMASTNKTQNLGLNNWLETDKPKRIDFVSDNTIIDNILGTHIKDSDLHLTSEEKDRVSQPFEISVGYGTGNPTKEMRTSFIPKMAIVFKTNSSPVKYANDYPFVNFCIATQKGTSGGAELVNDTLTLKQSNVSENGVYYNLNELYATYVIIYFK
ncbi:MAG: hypothetical protein J1E41_00960 [Ruminococcus sp.]|nr:hypothetical protein [Ruminococcus sp.]